MSRHKGGVQRTHRPPAPSGVRSYAPQHGGFVAAGPQTFALTAPRTVNSKHMLRALRARAPRWGTLSVSRGAKRRPGE